MAKHSVDVLIKARDKASKVFGIVGVSAKLLRGTLKSTAAVTKFAFAKMLQAAKYAAMGMAAALGYSTFAAIKQEAADVEMAAALKVTGQYSTEVMKKFKQQASAIQEATTYGDEYIETLMRMALTLGISEEKAYDAAKAAIALQAGFGGGRGKPEIFLRYYADAMGGNYASLSSYVVELRNAKTEEEKLIILQTAIARGWDAATSKTKSASGALKQMKNTLGDVAEVIGKPLLSEITKSAKAIKKWAEDNSKQIGIFADKAANVAILIKDVFVDLVEFMKTDWRSGMKWVFDSFIELLKTTFSVAIKLAFQGGMAIVAALKKGWSSKGSLEQIQREKFAQAGGKIYDPGQWMKMQMDEEWGDIKSIMLRKKALEEQYKDVGSGYRINKDQADLYEKAHQDAINTYTESNTTDLIKGALAGIAESFAESMKEIAESAPPGLKDKVAKTYQEFLDRLAKINKPPVLPEDGGGGGGGGRGTAAIKAGKVAKAQNWSPFESRTMKTAPGSRYDPAVETARNTKEQKDIAKQQLAETKKTNKAIVNLNITGGGTTLAAADL